MTVDGVNLTRRRRHGPVTSINVVYDPVSQGTTPNVVKLLNFFLFSHLFILNEDLMNIINKIYFHL